MLVSIERNPCSMARSKLTEWYREGEAHYFVHRLPDDKGFVIYPTVLGPVMLSSITESASQHNAVIVSACGVACL